MRRIICVVVAMLLMMFSAGIITGQTNSEGLQIGESVILEEFKDQSLSPLLLSEDRVLWMENDQYYEINAELYSKSIGDEKKILINNDILYTPHYGWVSRKMKIDGDRIAFLSADSTKKGKLWVGKTDGSKPIKSIASKECHGVSAIDIFDNKIYFWQHFNSDENSGLYTYDFLTGKVELLFDYNPKGNFHPLWLEHTGEYIVSAINYQELLILDKKGKERKRLNLGIYCGFDYLVTGTFFGICDNCVFFERKVYKISEDKKKELINVGKYIYDIKTFEFSEIDFGDKFNWIHSAKAIKNDPSVQTFIGYYKLEDVKGSGYHFIGVDPETKEATLIDKGSIIGSRTAPVARHFSATWKDYIIYPSDLEKDLIDIEIYNSKTGERHKVTKKRGLYKYPVINNNMITYYKISRDGHEIELIVHKISGME